MLKSTEVLPGMVLGWRTWTGAEATAKVTMVELGRNGPTRISTSTPGMYWESTFARSLDESLAATRGLRIL